MGQTLLDRVWESHVVRRADGVPDLLYVDLHLVHEVTSPQAFEGLRLAGRWVRRPDLTLATMDHNVPTGDDTPADPLSELQLATLARNCDEFGVPIFATGSGREGIVHVIGPELGLTQPGMTIVCGDSHTSTHGAVGALAFGIGTSEVEHVLATQCMLQLRPKTMNIRVEGTIAPGVTAKDLALAIIDKLGTGVGTGHVIEFSGSAIRGLSMEGRMTLCNMAIEAGARAGMVAPDDTTFAYIKGRPYAPKGELFEQAVMAWRQLASDPGAHFDAVHEVNIDGIGPQVTWGTNPGMVTDVEGVVPDPAQQSDSEQRKAYERALQYMGLQAGQKITDIPIDTVFIGSCTNSRLEDLRMAAHYVKGKRVASTVRAMVVPGSTQIRRVAEEEGLAAIFREAGFE